MKISELTMSMWTEFLREKKSYINPLYNEKTNRILQVNLSINSIKLWRNYYCRYLPDYQQTPDSKSIRSSTLLNLRNRLPTDLLLRRPSNADTSPVQSRSTSFIVSGSQTNS